MGNAKEMNYKILLNGLYEELARNWDNAGVSSYKIAQISLRNITPLVRWRLPYWMLNSIKILLEA